LHTTPGLSGRAPGSLPRVKRPLLRVAARVRVLGPAFRAYERALALRGRRPGIGPDDLPVPPPELIVRVAGTADVDWFLEGGRRGYESVRAHVPAGAPLGSVLDFGCGCGRVTRYWRGFGGSIAGSDLSGEAVAWCRANLPFGRFETNALEPPLAFADAEFDLVYGLSVFTHLAVDTQRRWFDELRRVLRPDGHLVLTTHGDSYRARLEPRERERFDAGEIVVRWGEVAGSNLCAAYHPRGALAALADGFLEIAHVPEGAAGNPHQDLHVFRRP
jgi:SAM-dependent methyltransferase